jgi:flavin-dependent dehydrogenase
VPISQAETVRWWDQLPSLRKVSLFRACIAGCSNQFVNKVVLESPSGHVIDFESVEPMYALVRRLEFDKALLDHCQEGGIEVREDVTVSRVTVAEDRVCLLSTSGEEFVADVVIGADGVNSVVAVHSGLRGPWRPTQVAFDGTEESPSSVLSARQDRMHIYFGMGGGYGYGYIFPKSSHVNFGAGYLLDYVKKHIPAKPYAQHLGLFEDLEARGVLSGHSERENFHLYPLPFAGPLEKISTHRILLAGDAAGFVNGFTAEGIYYAMLSGEHAARTALAAIRARDASARFLRRHDEACEAEVGHELRKSVALQKRFYSNPALIDLVVEFAGRNRFVKSLVAQFGTGQLSYEEMKRRILVGALPGYLGYQTRKLRNRLGVRTISQ